MIELRPTREEDLPELGRLLNQRFGHSIPAQEWGWKYRQIPGEARSLVAATPEGEVLAHAGALCLPAHWEGGDGGIWQLVDFAGSTSQGGLRPPLIELGRLLLADLPRAQDLPWIFGFPSARHFRLGERVFGYRPVGWIEELRGDLPTARPRGKVAIATGDSCSLWSEAAAPEAIWARAAGSGVRRSAAFLNWRYHARPERYYRFYRLAADGAEGLAVFAFVGAEAWGAELWLPAEAGWYPSMLAVAADLAAAGIRRWRFWAPDAGRYPELSRLLGSLGLAANGTGRFLGCRGAADSPAPPAPTTPMVAAAGFNHAMGDYDLV